MNANKANFRQSFQEAELKICQQGAKYLLPKLKSYSQNDVTSYSNLNLKSSANSHYPFTHERKATQNTNGNKTELSKLILVKYQYVSKYLISYCRSPAYFRRQQRSMNSVRFDDHSYHQPVESYVESKIKQFNKQALLDIVNSRVKTVAQSNSKLITIQQPIISQNTMNSRLNKTKINCNKLKAAGSSQKFSYLGTEARFNIKPLNSIEEKQQGRVFKSETNAKIALIQKGLSLIKKKSQNQDVKSSRNLKTLEHKNIEFYETKYSHFKPNKIENVKNHIQNIKKYPSLKLNLYNYQ